MPVVLSADVVTPAAPIAVVEEEASIEVAAPVVKASPVPAVDTVNEEKPSEAEAPAVDVVTTELLAAKPTEASVEVNAVKEDPTDITKNTQEHPSNITVELSTDIPVVANVLSDIGDNTAPPPLPSNPPPPQASLFAESAMSPLAPLSGSSDEVAAVDEPILDTLVSAAPLETVEDIPVILSQEHPIAELKDDKQKIDEKAITSESKQNEELPLPDVVTIEHPVSTTDIVSDPGLAQQLEERITETEAKSSEAAIDDVEPREEHIAQTIALIEQAADNDSTAISTLTPSAQPTDDLVIGSELSSPDVSLPLPQQCLDSLPSTPLITTESSNDANSTESQILIESPVTDEATLVTADVYVEATSPNILPTATSPPPPSDDQALEIEVTSNNDSLPLPSPPPPPPELEEITSETPAKVNGDQHETIAETETVAQNGNHLNGQTNGKVI